MTRFIRLCLTLAVVAASLLDGSVGFGGPPGQAGAETINYGQSALGQITRSSRVAFYFLRAQRGDVVNITMRRVSGSLDPQHDFATAEGGSWPRTTTTRCPRTPQRCDRDFTIQKTAST